MEKTMKIALCGAGLILSLAGVPARVDQGRRSTAVHSWRFEYATK